ncbi:MAG: hypothetical protein H0T44_09510 [Gemmatimonadales bacterium]|nr:hypothetical protein [Gemmatimonadales bacterium]
MGRSNAYWAGNRYPDGSLAPLPEAPLQDLPPAPAARFGLLRSGLLAIDDVVEVVRFMGATWRWAWEYGMGNRKLCWLHVVGNELSATFTVSELEEDRLRKGGRVPAGLLRALEQGQKTGPVKWCWLELDDRRAVDSFIRLARRKAEWLAERPVTHRKTRARAQPAAAEDDANEAE